jgi:hypothetical protein
VGKAKSVAGSVPDVALALNPGPYTTFRRRIIQADILPDSRQLSCCLVIVKSNAVEALHRRGR